MFDDASDPIKDELTTNYLEFLRDTRFHQSQKAKGKPPKSFLDAMKDPTWKPIFYAWAQKQVINNEVDFLVEVLSFKGNQNRSWAMAKQISDKYLHGLINAKYKGEILNRFPPAFQ